MFSYLLVGGVTTGALYALVALGIVIVYKATATVNFAHGALFMIRRVHRLHLPRHVGPALRPVAAADGGLLLRPRGACGPDRVPAADGTESHRRAGRHHRALFRADG